MILVLATSRGVVTAAAKAPAIAPHTAPCQGSRALPAALLHTDCVMKKVDNHAQFVKSHVQFENDSALVFVWCCAVLCCAVLCCVALYSQKDKLVVCRTSYAHSLLMRAI